MVWLELVHGLSIHLENGELEALTSLREIAEFKAHSPVLPGDHANLKVRNSLLRYQSHVPHLCTPKTFLQVLGFGLPSDH